MCFYNLTTSINLALAFFLASKSVFSGAEQKGISTKAVNAPVMVQGINLRAQRSMFSQYANVYNVSSCLVFYVPPYEYVDNCAETFVPLSKLGDNIGLLHPCNWTNIMTMFANNNVANYYFVLFCTICICRLALNEYDPLSNTVFV